MVESPVSTGSSPLVNTHTFIRLHIFSVIQPTKHPISSFTLSHTHRHTVQTLNMIVYYVGSALNIFICMHVTQYNYSANLPIALPTVGVMVTVAILMVYHPCTLSIECRTASFATYAIDTHSFDMSYTSL